MGLRSGSEQARHYEAAESGRDDEASLVGRLMTAAAFSTRATARA
jgi:hypothetical protein